MSTPDSAGKDAPGWTHEEAKAHMLTERLLERCAAYGGKVCGDRSDLPHCDWCERCLAAEALTLGRDAVLTELDCFQILDAHAYVYRSQKPGRLPLCKCGHPVPALDGTNSAVVHRFHVAQVFRSRLVDEGEIDPEKRPIAPAGFVDGTDLIDGLTNDTTGDDS